MSGTGRLAKGYFNFARALLAERKATLGPRAKRMRRPGHQQLLDRLSEQWSVDKATLGKLDGLRRTPVVGSMKRLASVLMLDKLLVGFIAALALLAFLLIFGFAWGSVYGLATALVGVGVVHYLDRGREVDPAGPLQLVPARILEHIDAKYVIFGHTHKPVRAVIDGGVYFNTGTWLPSGKPGLLRAFTHVVINHTATGAEAELCQWRDGESQPFALAGRDPAKATSAERATARRAQESAASTGLPR